MAVARISGSGRDGCCGVSSCWANPTGVDVREQGALEKAGVSSWASNTIGGGSAVGFMSLRFQRYTRPLSVVTKYELRADCRFVTTAGVLSRRPSVTLTLLFPTFNLEGGLVPRS